ncbi:MAG: MazG family protein [Eubacteriales bacterium]
MNKMYTMEDFLNIIETLRSEGGCPWDREQTHDTLRPCMVEEAYELVSAIGIYEKSSSYENMREELGDVLLQVVMHSQIAKEEGLFSFEDVVQEVAAKMVHRHPHVFGQVEVSNSNEVIQNWEELKKQEKEGKAWIASPLQEVPKELPALIRSSKVHKKIRQVYHVEENEIAAVNTMQELTSQLGKILQTDETESDKETLTNILGDLLMEITTVASIEKINVEQILADKIDDLIDRVENNQ